ncbi:MAG: glycosidase [Candidatus Makaraimicrobium thalassicum]|nr:MAG: glycosidase [Candidatus Omnitrophota bacterium]
MVLKRYKGNPILAPRKENPWESVMVYNCAAIYEDGKVHILYRAQGSKTGVSRLGYASSRDGFHIDERLDEPVFGPDPASDLESLGIEDPRLTRIGDTIYMNYSAYGTSMGMVFPLTRVQIGITSISVDDFLEKKWNWGDRYYPFYMVDDKNSFFFPEKVNGRYVFVHRIPPHMWIAYSDDLKTWDNQKILMSPEFDWEYFKIGGGAPPIKTEKGWILIYHGVDRSMHYRLGVALLDLEDPGRVIRRYDKPFLEAEADYEISGVVPNVTFSCGAVVIDDTLFVYYGGADTVICVATAKVKEVLHLLKA